MTTFRPRILEATNATERMDALCEFIEFWMGPRHDAYGECADTLLECPLPTPLKRLYGFAGRWPSWRRNRQLNRFIPLMTADRLLFKPEHIKIGEDEKIKFMVEEDEETRHFRTLPQGDDPPVWCHGVQFEPNKPVTQGVRIICNSLSRFLVTVVLLELASGSRFQYRDPAILDMLSRSRSSNFAVWNNGPKLYGSDITFALLNGALVSDLTPFHFSTNSFELAQFLEKHQSPVSSILLSSGPWILHLKMDGFATVRYVHRKSGGTERAETSAGIFDFPEILTLLSHEATVEGATTPASVTFHRGPMCTLMHRQGLKTLETAAALFQTAINALPDEHQVLKQWFSKEWTV